MSESYRQLPLVVGATERRWKNCPTCGVDFRVKPSHYDIKRYCCKACMAEGYRQRLRGEANPNYRDAGRRICACCGGTFLSYSKKQRCCSKSCSARLAWQHPDRKPRPPRPRKPKEQRGARPRVRRSTCASCGAEVISGAQRKYCDACTPRNSVPIVTMECVICGSTFQRKANQPRQTCSDACDAGRRSQRQRGERSHRWRGGKTRPSLIVRGSLEYQQWRRRVFGRDDFTCQLCGVRGGRLSAHHIKQFDKQPDLAMVDTNGITLCWPCHASIRHREQDYENRFFEITGGAPDAPGS